MIKKSYLLILILMFSGLGSAADLSDRTTGSACGPEEYKMEIVVLTKPEEQPTEEEMDLIQELPSRFEDEFHRATWGERDMIVDNDIKKIQINDSMTRNGGSPIYSKIIPSYFDKEPAVDFLSFYAAYEIENIPQTHTTMQNYIQGIGEPAPYRFGEDWMPSNELGNLRGITFQGELHSPEGQTDSESIMRMYIRGLFHEIGHQWCCSIGSNFDGEYDEDLEILHDGMHYYPGLYNPTEMGSPMNAGHWRETSDEDYERISNFSKISPYHPFTMYLMTGSNVSEKSSFTLYDAGVIGEEFDDDSAEPVAEISLSDIIENTEQRECVVKDKKLELEMAPEDVKVGEEVVITPKIGSDPIRANIWINNTAYGSTKELKFKPTEPGEYNVHINKSKEEKEDKIIRYNSESSDFEATLKKINRSLEIEPIQNITVGEEIQIQPRTEFGAVKAEIKIENQTYEKHQKFEFSPEKPGNYTIHLTKSNERNGSKKIRFESKKVRLKVSKKKKRKKMELKLSKNPVYQGEPVTLTPKVNSSPVNATIRIGNKSYYDLNKLNYIPNKTGEITVKVSKRSLSTPVKIVSFEPEEKNLIVERKNIIQRIIELFENIL